MAPGRQWQPLGDSCFLLAAPDAVDSAACLRAAALAPLLRAAQVPGVADVVAAFGSVAVHFDPLFHQQVGDWLAGISHPTRNAVPSNPCGKLVEIPVCYNGGDLDRVASAAGTDRNSIVAAHSGAEFTVAAIGFSPGFPYLLGLPESLRLPRKASPEPVRAGAVAIAAGNACIYPNASPGGWHVLGHTSIRLFSADQSPPTLLETGDRVRFHPVRESVPDPTSTEPPPDILPPDPGRDFTEVLDPGPLTSVQDLGRPGHQDAGISPGGAVDPGLAVAANLLAGNPPGAAVLECALRGPKLRFSTDRAVALVGFARADSGTILHLRSGGVLDCGPCPAVARAYVAIQGGITVPEFLGSRATDVRAGFGGLNGRMLKTGDKLPLGRSDSPHGSGRVLRVAIPIPTRGFIQVRVLRGIQADWFGEDTWREFLDQPFLVTSRADRMGMQLQGPTLRRSHPGEPRSGPVCAGTIQVPPNGLPLVLLAERQTLGGYPQIAHVIRADLPLLARALPGQSVRFAECSLPDAIAAWKDARTARTRLQAGLELFR